MTRAPSNILEVRNLLLTHLNVDKSRVRESDLEPAEVGVVGDVNHRGGYHCGSDRVVRNDYSVVESIRDKSGLTDYASALDAGTFSYTKNGRTHNLRTFSAWMVAQCEAGAADCRDIREIIYSPDGKTVKRWDRLKRRTSGDSSHLYHTHFSFFRDATKSGRDLTGPFRRYLIHIGAIAAPKPQPAPTPKEIMMELSDRIKGTNRAADTVENVLADQKNLRDWWTTPLGEYDGPYVPATGSPLDLLVRAAKKILDA